MRAVRTRSGETEVHGSAYTTLLHPQAFGASLSGDLDAAAGGDGGALQRVAWSMAATAARALGRPAPSLGEVELAGGPGALLAAVLAEAERGCFVAAGEAGEGGDGGQGGGRGSDEALLALCLARGVDPAALALVSTGCLLAALSPSGGTRGAPAARPATSADIMRLLG